jgi:hypothetical protein
MIARALEDITVAVHYLVMAYIVFGGFLAWRWRWTIWTHLAIIGWAVISLIFPVSCPLTWLEDTFRHQAGLPSLDGGFINTYITGVLYPRGDMVAVQIAAGVIVLVSWAGMFVRWDRHGLHRTRRVHQVRQVRQAKLG